MIKNDLREYYKTNFSYLTDEDIDVLSAHSKLVNFKPGDSLLEIEKYENQLFYIIEGLVRGYKYVNEYEEYNLYFVENKKSLISPEKIIYKDKRLNTVGFTALSNVSTIQINFDELEYLAKNHEGIFEFYTDIIKQMLTDINARMQILLLENAGERYKMMKEKRPTLLEYAPKKHIAQFLGITPNSYSRLIRYLKSEKQNK